MGQPANQEPPDTTSKANGALLHSGSTRLRKQHCFKWIEAQANAIEQLLASQKLKPEHQPLQGGEISAYQNGSVIPEHAEKDPLELKCLYDKAFAKAIQTICRDVGVEFMPPKELKTLVENARKFEESQILLGQTQSEVQIMKSRLESLEEDKHMLEKDAHENRTKLQSLQRQNQDLKVQTDTKQTQNDQLVHQNQNISAQFRLLKEQCEAITAENQQLRLFKERCEAITAENQQFRLLKEQCEAITAENQQLRLFKEQCEAITAENQQLRMLKERCEAVTAENQQLRLFKEQCEAITAENQQLRLLKERCEAVTAENQQLRLFKEQCEALTAENQQLRLLKEHCESITAENQRLRLLKEQCEAITAQNQQLEIDVQTLKLALNDDIPAQQSTEENERHYKNTLLGISERLRMIQSNSNDEIKKLNEERDMYYNQVQKLKLTNVELQNAVQLEKKQAMKKLAVQDSLENEVLRNGSGAQHPNQHGVSEKNQQELKSLQTDLSATKRSLQQQIDEYVELEGIHKKIAKELESYKANGSQESDGNLELEKNQLDEHLDLQKTKYSELQSEYDKLRSQYGNAISEYEHTHSQLNAVQSQLQELQTQHQSLLDNGINEKDQLTLDESDDVKRKSDEQANISSMQGLLVNYNATRIFQAQEIEGLLEECANLKHEKRLSESAQNDSSADLERKNREIDRISEQLKNLKADRMQFRERLETDMAASVDIINKISILVGDNAGSQSQLPIVKMLENLEVQVVRMKQQFADQLKNLDGTISACDSQIEELSHQKQYLAEQNASLKNSVHILKEELHRLPSNSGGGNEVNVTKLLTQLEQASEERDRLNIKVREHEKEILDFRELADRRDVNDDGLDPLSGRFGSEEIAEENRQLHLRVKDLQRNVKDVQDEQSRLLRDEHSLQDSLENERHKVDELSAMLETLREDNAKLLSDGRSLNYDNDVIEENRQLHHHIKQLQETVKELQLEQKKWLRDEHSLKDGLENERHKVAELSGMLETLREDNSKLLSDGRSRNHDNDVIEENRQLHHHIKELQETVKELQLEQTKWLRDEHSLKDGLENERHKVAELSGMLESLRQESTKFLNDRRSLSQDDEIIEESRQLHCQVEDLQRTVKELQDEQMRLLRNEDSFKTELDNERHKIDELSGMLRSLREENSNLMDDGRSLNQDTRELNDRLNQLSTEKWTLQTQLSDLQVREVAPLKKAITLHKSNANKLTQENQDLRERLISVEEDGRNVPSLALENSNLKKEIRVLAESEEELKKELEFAKKSHEERTMHFESCEKDNAVLRRTQADHNTDLTELRQKYADMKSKYTRAQRDTSKLVSDLQIQKNKVVLCKKALKKFASSMINRIRLIQREHTHFKEQVHGQLQELDTFVTTTMKQHISLLLESLRQARRDQEQSLGQVDQLRNVVDAQHKKIRHLEQGSQKHSSNGSHKHGTARATDDLQSQHRDSLPLRCHTRTRKRTPTRKQLDKSTTYLNSFRKGIRQSYQPVHEGSELS